MFWISVTRSLATSAPSLRPVAICSGVIGVLGAEYSLTTAEPAGTSAGVAAKSYTMMRSGRAIFGPSYGCCEATLVDAQLARTVSANNHKGALRRGLMAGLSFPEF